jgi:hypothetical protein
MRFVLMCFLPLPNPLPLGEGIWFDSVLLGLGS